MINDPSMEIARPLRRLGARILDLIILSIAGGILFFTLRAIGLGEVVAYIIVGLIYLLYELVLIAGRGQTLGKLIARIKVVSAETGGIPEMRQSFIRMLFIVFPGVISNVLGNVDNDVIGFLVVIVGLVGLLITISLLFDSFRRQGWQDKAANTLVINVYPEAYRGPGRPGVPEHLP